MTISINTNNVAASSLDLVNAAGQNAPAQASGHKHAHGAHAPDYLLSETLQALTAENGDAAESSPADLDAASSIAQLVKTQLLQQGGSGLLAQANTSPDTVARLLN